MNSTLLACCALLATGCAPARLPAAVSTQDAPTVSLDVSSAVDARLTAAAQTEGFGGVIMLVRGGEVSLAKGYGFADRQAGRPYDVNTIHDIGSITKQFTAAGLSG